MDFLSCFIAAVEKALKDAGVEKIAVDDVVLAGGSSRIPRIQKLLQDFFDGKDLLKSINLDEVVAYGAALQAAVLTGDREGNGDEHLSDDMTMLSVGIETAGGLLTPVIDRHVKFPAKGLHVVTTNVDGQTSLMIGIYEGERAMCADNVRDFQQLVVWSVDRLIEWVSDWLIDWLIASLIASSIDWVIEWLIDWLFSFLNR